jgi:hypothetical protein
MAGVAGVPGIWGPSAANDGQRPRIAAERPAPILPEPVTPHDTIATSSEPNQHGWLAAGRCVMKGEKGIRLVAPDTFDDGRVTSIRPVYVFDVTQTQELQRRAA